jgi:hypothetical protein
VMVAGLLGACSADTSRMKSDWEIENAGRLVKEEEASLRVDLPPFPRRQDLVEFFVSAASDFRFFVDRTSISLAGERVVRYVLVARSPSGAENVSYEGINCRNGEYIVYAAGTRDRGWLSRSPQWRPIEPGRVQGRHNVLQREYFCPSRIAIASEAEGVRALEQGGHARARQPDPLSGPGR